MYGGTILQLDLAQKVHVYYLLIIELSFTIYVLLSFALRTRADIYSVKGNITGTLKRPKLMWFFFILSLTISFLYYRALGYNLISLIISGVSSQEISTLRLESYSGSTYYAPGYVNQFKNILLPLTFTILLFRSWKNRRRLEMLILILLLPLVLLFILGTGQRAFLVYTFVCVYIGLIRIIRVRRSFQIFGAASVVLLFGVSSYYLGRISDVSFVSIMNGLLERVLLTEQHDSIVGFEYVFSKSIQFGKDWAQSLLGILPGHKGSTLQHEIFKIMHGTDRGTGAISTLGSIYYNFDFIGVIICTSLVGLLHYKLDRIFYTKRLSIDEVFIFAFLIFYVGNWVSGDIMYLFNKGVIALLLLLFLLKFRISNG